MGGHGIFQHLLDVIDIVIIEEFAFYKEAGMADDDHDAVELPALAVLRDIRKIARIGLYPIVCKAAGLCPWQAKNYRNNFLSS